MRVKNTLSGKIIIICLAFVFFGIAINTTVHTTLFITYYSKAIISRAFGLASAVKYKLDFWIKRDVPLDKVEGFDSECRAIITDYNDISYAIVIDSAGKVLYHNSPEEHGKYFQFPVGTPAITSFEQDKTTFFSTADYDNVAIPITESSGSNVIGAIIIGYPRNIAVTTSRNMIIVSFASTTILTVILLFFFIFIITSWITRPFTNLINRIEGIRSGGSLDADTIATSSTYEISQLTSAFTNLLSELKASQIQLEHHTQELEIKVEARTRELNNVNNNLMAHIAALEHSKEEEKRLHKQLERSQKLEAIGNLASGVAHDLNNILSGLINYPELLLMEMPSDSPFITPITNIKRAGERAAAMVQDLLTLARRGVALTVPVNINEVINDLAESPEYQSLLNSYSGIKVIMNLDKNISNIMGTPFHISKVLLNLVTNSAEAIDEHGEIKITTETCILKKKHKGFEVIPSGEYIRLSIEDDGIGISKEHIEKIFEPFYSKKVLGRRSGTGLGMSVVYSTVKDHSGYIDVTSSIGNGTVISLYFSPTTNQPEAIEKGATLEEFMGNGEKILVVDDVEEQRDIALTLLDKLGYKGISVSCGEEAVEYMQTHSVDCVILDMIMDPGIDGLETYRRIAEIHPGQKAIITSGFAETNNVLDMQKLGAGSFVKKPYSIDKLGIALKNELHDMLR